MLLQKATSKSHILNCSLPIFISSFSWGHPITLPPDGHHLGIILGELLSPSCDEKFVGATPLRPQDMVVWKLLYNGGSKLRSITFCQWTKVHKITPPSTGMSIVFDAHFRLTIHVPFQSYSPSNRKVLLVIFDSRKTADADEAIAAQTHFHNHND